jgi:hypothetical protein
MADKRLESNPRNDRPLSDRLSYYPMIGDLGDQEGRQHGTESRNKLPPSGPSHRARVAGRSSRNAGRPRISRNEDRSTKSTPADEGERRIGEVILEETDPLLTRPDGQQQGTYFRPLFSAYAYALMSDSRRAFSTRARILGG